MDDRLTVAVPTCNGAAHLGEAIRSILAQSDRDFDLLVSDDRSDDDSLAVIRAEAGDRARVVVNPERLGLAGNWNRCAELAQTPWVAIFHQDDRMRADHLAGHRRAFGAEPGVGMVVSAAGVIDGEGRDVSASVVGRGGMGSADAVFQPPTLLPRLAVENPIRCSGVTLRVRALVDAGGFDPSFRYVVDWDCWIRIARRWPVAWLANPSVDIRWHLASETHRFKGGTEDLDETSRLLGLAFGPGDDMGKFRRGADRRLSRAFLHRAYEAAVAGDPALSRRCQRRAVGLWPGILGRVAVDPRLAARLAGSYLRR